MLGWSWTVNWRRYGWNRPDVCLKVLWKIANKPQFVLLPMIICQSQWPRGLSRRSTAARLLRLWVRIPPGAWMFVCRECCVLSGRGRDLCDELITRPEECCRLWCVVVCDLETSWMRRPWPTGGWGCRAKNKQTQIIHTRRLHARSLPHHVQRALLCLACYRESFTNLTSRDNNTGTAPDVLRSADIS